MRTLVVLASVLVVPLQLGHADTTNEDVAAPLLTAFRPSAQALAAIDDARMSIVVTARVCVDARGSVTSRHATSSDVPLLDHEISRSLAQTRPAAPADGRPVCVVDRAIFGADTAVDDVPQIIAPNALESLRRSGERQVEPDDATHRQIVRDGKDRVIGSFKLCVDRRGVPARISTLKSTGYHDYDTALTARIESWRYDPTS